MAELLDNVGKGQKFITYAGDVMTFTAIITGDRDEYDIILMKPEHPKERCFPAYQHPEIKEGMLYKYWRTGRYVGQGMETMDLKGVYPEVPETKEIKTVANLNKLKKITKAADFPEGPQYVILILDQDRTDIPGDERSRTNPGHGYPAYTKTTDTYEMYVTNSMDDWKDALTYLYSSVPAPKNILAFAEVKKSMITQSVQIQVG